MIANVGPQSNDAIEELQLKRVCLLSMAYHQRRYSSLQWIAFELIEMNHASEDLSYVAI